MRFAHSLADELGSHVHLDRLTVFLPLFSGAPGRTTPTPLNRIGSLVERTLEVLDDIGMDFASTFLT